MAKLPFVVEPRLKPVMELIGSEESGKIEIERRGYLTVAEKSFVQGALSDDTAITEMHQLAQRIARKSGIKQSDVFQMLIGAMEDEGDNLVPFEAEIGSALSAMIAYQEKNKLVVAACMLMNRVNPELTMEDVMAVHPDLVDALMALYEDEDRKCTDALEAAAADEPKAEEGKE
jgi:hypothetical protein